MFVTLYGLIINDIAKKDKVEHSGGEDTASYFHANKALYLQQIHEREKRSARLKHARIKNVSVLYKTSTVPRYQKLCRQYLSPPNKRANGRPLLSMT